ncbi:MAG: acyltransferase family protein [Agathobacter sp.]|nr:acyltransferase family protein [Agathobacter sp.]
MKLIKNDGLDCEYWDIVKGIGIILVVVGHFCWDLTQFIYLFHLPLFFFVSGYLYNEEKYGDNPYLNVAARLKSSWMKYVLIFWVLIWTHNLWIQLKIAWVYPGIYDIADIAREMIEALFGQGGESFGITLWFVPVLVLSTCLLGFVVSFSRKIAGTVKQSNIKYFVQFVILLLCTLLGYYLEKMKVSLPAEAQVSFVVMPFLWVGYLIRNVKLDIKAYLNPIIAFVCGVIVWLVSTEFRMDLAMKWVYPAMHIIALFGIYMCLYLAKIIQRIASIKDVFVLYGKETFGIMFIHLPLCRLFDWCFIQLNYPEQFEELYYVIDTVIFPERFWGLYLFIGLVLSLGICIGFKYSIRWFKCGVTCLIR